MNNLHKIIIIKGGVVERWVNLRIFLK